LAVVGEYNKNSSSPGAKLHEVVADTAFERHTYKHTTMGFLKDIQDMPNQYEYSLKFFDRYYRPEYTTIVVVGDVKTKVVRDVVEKSWGEWKRGSYKPEIPAEPYLLPAGSETLGCSRGSGACTRNVIEFKNYKKFTTESTISFGK
jgi:zinc protease